MRCRRNSHDCPKRSPRRRALLTEVANCNSRLRGEWPQVVVDLAFAEVGIKATLRRQDSARRLPCPILKCALALVAVWARPVNSDDPFMIATAPVVARLEPDRVSLDYLLLGDLRLLLEEPACVQRNRWLVATLDMLLMSRPRSGPSIYSPPMVAEPGRGFPVGRFAVGGPVPFEKLQRLRDRIVHRAPSEVLIQELKGDLCEWAEGVMVLAPMTPPASAG